MDFAKAEGDIERCEASSMALVNFGLLRRRFIYLKQI